MTSRNDDRMTMDGNKDERWLGRLRAIGWSLVAIVLLLPAIAMQFSDEVKWSAGDFLFAAVLLGGTGGLVELLVRRSQDAAYRAGGALALLAVLLLAWVNAAVGLVGSGANAANILYVALVGVAVASGFAAGFRAAGMAKAMVATAVGQALITVLVVSGPGLLSGPEPLTGPGSEAPAVIGANGFFIVLWSVAALLFRKAAQRGAA